MNPRRLDRLKRLATGVALAGATTAGLSCEEPKLINGPSISSLAAPDVETANGAPADDAGTTQPRPNHPLINAPRRPADAGTDAPAADADTPAAGQAEDTAPNPGPPIRLNAPPRRAPTADAGTPPAPAPRPQAPLINAPNPKLKQP
jgi:hypothetical protein